MVGAHLLWVAPRNTVLFQSATVTITLDEQVQAGLVTCDLTCHFNPVGITTDAIDVELHNANLEGHAVSGHIVVAQAKAGTGSPTPTPVAAAGQ